AKASPAATPSVKGWRSDGCVAARSKNISASVRNIADACRVGRTFHSAPVNMPGNQAVSTSPGQKRKLVGAFHCGCRATRLKAGALNLVPAITPQCRGEIAPNGRHELCHDPLLSDGRGLSTDDGHPAQ